MLHDKLKVGDIVYRANWHNVPWKIRNIVYNFNNTRHYIHIIRYDGLANTKEIYLDYEFDLLFYISIKNTLKKL